MKHFAAAIVVLMWSAVTSTPAAAEPPSCNGLPATIVASGPGDPVMGTDGDDVIVGGTWRDQIDGLGGNDTICGGLGDDKIVPGPGDDWVEGGIANDEIRLDAGNDHVDGSTGIDTLIYEATDPASIDLLTGSATGDGIGSDDLAGDENLRAGRSTKVTFVSGPGTHKASFFECNSDLTITTGRVAIATDGGVHRIRINSPEGAHISADNVLGSTHVIVEGGPGPEYVDGFDEGAGLDFDLDLGDGNDMVWVGSHRLRADLGRGNDLISARVPTGDGFVRLGPGNDQLRLISDTGMMPIRGGLGADTVLGDTFDDATEIVDLGAGFAKLTWQGHVWFVGALSGFENVRANSALHTVLRGNARRNVLVGSTGHDKLVGRGGDDRLIGLGGWDRADGGPGIDTCRAERRTHCER